MVVAPEPRSRSIDLALERSGWWEGREGSVGLSHALALAATSHHLVVGRRGFIAISIASSIASSIVPSSWSPYSSSTSSLGISGRCEIVCTGDWRSPVV